MARYVSYQVHNFTETPADYVPGTGELHAVFHTNLGDIDIVLYENEAPHTVANFVGLATGKRTWIDPQTQEERNDPYYDGVIFHRVIKGFMLQGGDRLGVMVDIQARRAHSPEHHPHERTDLQPERVRQR